MRIGNIILAGNWRVRARKFSVRPMAAELFIARLPTLNRIEVVEAELATGQRHGSFLQHLKSKCR